MLRHAAITDLTHHSLLVVEDALIHRTIISKIGDKVGFATRSASSVEAAEGDLEIRAAVEIDGDAVRVDFEGTAPQHGGNLNCPLAVTVSACCFVLRVVAEHADLWNIAGGDIDDVISRSALLDRYCAEIGRDPASVTRSIHLPVSYDEPSITRDAIGEAIDAGFQHIVLGLTAPYPADVAQWVTDKLITTSV